MRRFSQPRPRLRNVFFAAVWSALRAAYCSFNGGARSNPAVRAVSAGGHHGFCLCLRGGASPSRSPRASAPLPPISTTTSACRARPMVAASGPAGPDRLDEAPTLRRRMPLPRNRFSSRTTKRVFIAQPFSPERTAYSRAGASRRSRNDEKIGTPSLPLLRVADPTLPPIPQSVPLQGPALRPTSKPSFGERRARP